MLTLPTKVPSKWWKLLRLWLHPRIAQRRYIWYMAQICHITLICWAYLIKKLAKYFNTFCFNPLVVQFFAILQILQLAWRIFYIPWPGTEFFFHNYGLPQTFGTQISRAWFIAPPLSTVQGKCIYNIFKAENQETQFPYLYTKPSIDKISFYLSKVCSPEADLSSIRPSMFVQFNWFIGNPWHNSWIEWADLPAIHAK